jgi:hypothetical protein
MTGCARLSIQRWLAVGSSATVCGTEFSAGIGSFAHIRQARIAARPIGTGGRPAPSQAAGPARSAPAAPLQAVDQAAAARLPCSPSTYPTSRGAQAHQARRQGRLHPRRSPRTPARLQEAGVARRAERTAVAGTARVADPNGSRPLPRRPPERHIWRDTQETFWPGNDRYHITDAGVVHRYLQRSLVATACDATLLAGVFLRRVPRPSDGPDQGGDGARRDAVRDEAEQSLRGAPPAVR